jgi:thiol-disulfide isomerase/thioredoxin
MRNLPSHDVRRAGKLSIGKRVCLVLSMTFCLFLSLYAPQAKGEEIPERQTVLLDFTASWCGPCQRMAPIVEELVRMGYPVRKVDIDREPALAKRFAIQAVPTFVMLINGQEAKRIVGGASLDDLVALCRLAPRSGSPGGSSAVLASTNSLSLATAQPSSASGRSSVRTATSQTKASGTIPPLDESSRFAGANEQDLIAVTVRIRVEDPQGRSTGSGTIIDARGGEALIVTCGHLFRESQGKTPILVDLFCAKPVQGIPAQLIYYDDRLDIGFLSIRPGVPVVVARVASPGYPLAVGDAVYSVGCSESQPPTVWDGRITALDKYLGPSNIEASRAPLVGRSGGGLFSNEGFLIGVCNAADPPLNEGIYLALREIHRSLDQLNLAFVYRWDTSSNRLAQGSQSSPAAARTASNQPGEKHASSPSNSSLGLSSIPPGETASPLHTQFGRTASPALGASPEAITIANGLPLPIPSAIRSNGESRTIASGDAGKRSLGSSVIPVAFANQGELSAEEQATLEEIIRRQAGGQNIVCVIQPADPDMTRSEIIIVRQPSPQLLRALNQAGVTTVLPGDLAKAPGIEPPLDPFSSRLSRAESDGPLVPISSGTARQLSDTRNGDSTRSVASRTSGTSAQSVGDTCCVLPASIMALSSPRSVDH